MLARLIRLLCFCFIAANIFVLATNVGASTILFDASKQVVSGNADWVIDADLWDLYLEHYPCGEYANEANAQFLPTPDQGLIVDETDWDGAISAWGFDLVQAGHTVYTLPANETITYGQPGQYDLSQFDLFIMPEPQIMLTLAEKTAVLDFVAAGGALFMVADHQTSDRNCSGSDSPHIFNDLMGVSITGGIITSYGEFGIVFNVEEISSMTSVDYWFTDAIDDNVSTDPLDPIIFGPFGDGSGGLGLFGSTSMTLDPGTNPTVEGHVWKTDAGGQSTTRVTFVTAQYGLGRIAAIGDSSPADDGTGDSGDTLYDGWDKASGGVTNDIIHMNACAWLLTGIDVDPPIITVGPESSAEDCTSIITWQTDELATSLVEYGLDTGYGQSESLSGYRSQHTIILTGLTPSTLYHYRVVTSDTSGNGPTYSSDLTFTTSIGVAPSILTGPNVNNVTGSSATITWTTDEAADSVIDYGLTTSYGSQLSDPSFNTIHSVTLSSLSPETTYHYQVSSTDSCGNGPAQSDDNVFTTGSADFEISGWTIYQYGSNATYSFPTNTLLAAGSYVVVARNCNQTSFQSFWGMTLGSNVLFINSNEDGSCLGTDGCLPLINGGESYELADQTDITIDGPTITGSADKAYHRIAAGLPANDPASWSETDASLATPGQGMPSPTGIGVVISEWSDALGGGNYIYEFIELFNDNASMTPDDIPPATVNDLDTIPFSADTIRLTFTSVGDDDLSGTASTYDIRYSPSPIRSEVHFSLATTVSGEPSPQLAGNTETIDISGLQPDQTYFFALKVGDEVPLWSGLSNTSGATTGISGSVSTDHIVISEIQTRGISDHNDEFIELYNPTDSPISLSGLSVQKKVETGGTFEKYDLPADSISAYGYYLIARPEYSNVSVPADTIQSIFNMSYHGGNIALVGDTNVLSGCSDPDVIDMVGYLNGDCAETSPAPGDHNAGETIERKPGDNEPGCGNGEDTDNNQTDFILRSSAEPQNSSNSEPPCSGLSNVGNTLFITGTLLEWTPSLGAVNYKIRRNTEPDFMLTDPIPSDVNLLTTTSLTQYSDPELPPGSGAGDVFYYFINAVAGANESNY